MDYAHKKHIFYIKLYCSYIYIYIFVLYFIYKIYFSISYKKNDNQLSFFSNLSVIYILFVYLIFVFLINLFLVIFIISIELLILMYTQLTNAPLTTHSTAYIYNQTNGIKIIHMYCFFDVFHNSKRKRILYNTRIPIQRIIKVVDTRNYYEIKFI